MSKQDEDLTSSGVEGARTAPGAPDREVAALPRPPMLWLIVPVALLALLALLSRS